MSEPNYNEEWIVSVDRKEFITDKEGKDKILFAIKTKKRFVQLNEKDIISVRHISYIYMASRTIKNQLEAGQKKETNFKPIPRENLEKIKKEIYSKIGKKIK